MEILLDELAYEQEDKPPSTPSAQPETARLSRRSYHLETPQKLQKTGGLRRSILRISSIELFDERSVRSGRK